jgi:hypothetical protein
LGLVEEVQQLLELRLGLAREADDEGAADGESGQIARQRWMRSRVLSPLAGRFISLRMRGLACWNGMSR